MYQAISRIAFAAAIMFATACSEPAQTPTADATSSGISDNTAATVSPTSAQSLVGRWGDNGDCTKDIVFAEDGTFRSYTGGTGSWTLDGNTMTMSGAGGTFQVQIEIIGDSQLLIQNPDGSVGTSQRC